jgi:hypothetical protein
VRALDFWIYHVSLIFYIDARLLAMDATENVSGFIQTP